MLTLITKLDKKTKDKKSVGLFECDCGNKCEAIIRDVRRGKRKSCGCKKDPEKDLAKSTYRAWQAMIHRCYNDKMPYYKNYGGRGIVVCDRWRFSYENFLKDMGLKPAPGYSVERVDNNGNYEPGNCVWGTRYDQSNNRRNNIQLTFQDKTQNASQWAKELDIPLTIIYNRLRAGWSIDKTLSTPVIRKVNKTLTGCCWINQIKRNKKHVSSYCNGKCLPGMDLCSKHYKKLQELKNGCNKN